MSDIEPCRFNEPGGLTVNELVGMIQDGGESLRFAHAELIRRHFGAYECGLSLGKAEARVAELEKLVEHTMMEVPGYDSDRSVAEQLPLEVMLLRKESEKKLSHTLATCERLSARVAELEGERNRALGVASGHMRKDASGIIGTVSELLRERNKAESRAEELQAQLERANRAARLHENKLFLLDECLRGPSCPETRISSALTLVRSKVESDGT